MWIAKAILDSIMAKQFGQLAAGQLLALSSGFALLKQQTRGRWHWGTACSGSEVLYLALEALQQFWKKRFADTPNIGHAFSCESVEFKRDWIHEHFSPNYMFEDIHLLHGDVVKDIEGKDIADVACDVFAAGVECDSISSLNKEHSDNFDCAAKPSGQPSKTGDTARSAIAFLRKRRPPVALLENVKNLACVGKSGQSNLTWLIKSANQLGYYVVDMVLGASGFGVPQQRDRLYMICVFYDQFVDQTCAGAEVPEWVLDLKQFINSMQIESFELREFLLEDSDPGVVATNQAIAESTKPQGRKKSQKKRQVEDSEDAGQASMPHTHNVQKYEVEHLDHYSQQKVTWPPVFPQSFTSKAACVSPRKKEILYLDECVSGPTDSLTGFRCRDLNMSMSWGVWQDCVCPCIVSSSITWLRGTCRGREVDRLLSGRELMQLQGWDARREGKTARVFSQREIVDLAGNAFCGAVLYPVVTGIVACVPWATAFRAKQHAHVGGPAASAKPLAIPLQAPPAVINHELSDSESMSVQEEAGESEELEPDSVVEDDFDLSDFSFGE